MVKYLFELFSLSISYSGQEETVKEITCPACKVSEFKLSYLHCSDKKAQSRRLNLSSLHGESVQPVFSVFGTGRDGQGDNPSSLQDESIQPLQKRTGCMPGK
jgi:hypothetical protein